MIDKHLFTNKFVVYDDVIAMANAEGVTDDAEVTRRAKQIWVDDCFTLDIYRTDDGQERTLAEFMCDWLQSGYTWEASIAHLETLSPTTKRLREKSASTCDPQDRVEIEGAADPS